jgi:hypothetical protein
MTVPQPFQYQGSKRALAPLILQYLPVSTTRLVKTARNFSSGFMVQPANQVPEGRKVFADGHHVLCRPCRDLLFVGTSTQR